VRADESVKQDRPSWVTTTNEGNVYRQNVTSWLQGHDLWLDPVTRCFHSVLVTWPLCVRACECGGMRATLQARNKTMILLVVVVGRSCRCCSLIDLSTRIITSLTSCCDAANVNPRTRLASLCFNKLNARFLYTWLFTKNTDSKHRHYVQTCTQRQKGIQTDRKWQTDRRRWEDIVCELLCTVCRCF